MKKSKDEEMKPEETPEEIADTGEEFDSVPETDSGEVVSEDASQEDDGEAKYLRLAADFQNYKRRMEKERFERYSEGKKDFAADLLPVLDNFDRALQHEAAGDEASELESFVEGMEMILKQLLGALEKNGVSEITALGEDFDPNFHHAVAMEASEEYGSQKVSSVLQKGYKAGDKVIRPAMVKVAE